MSCSLIHLVGYRNMYMHVVAAACFVCHWLTRTVAAFQCYNGGSSWCRYSSRTCRHSAATTTSLQAVRFASPLLESGYPPAVKEAELCRHLNISNPKPLLLYLPGFDGTLVAPFLQFPEQGTIFEVRGMEVPMDDRSTFSLSLIHI